MTDEEQGDSKSIEEQKQEAREELEELEESPPESLDDWPSGDAKYETFGGPEHESSYGDSATANLGPSDVRHHPDGSVTVDGEEADPDDFKGEPIPGGPTDPDAAKISGERDLSGEDSAAADADADAEGDA